MIDVNDQKELFKLIGKLLLKDVTCYAIGGTAIMFHGYKNTTKDIDLVFESLDELKEFERVILSLGYKKQSLKGIYSNQQLDFKTKPVMYTRGDERFDLFYQDVFGFKFSSKLKELVEQKHEFVFDNELIINTLPKEYLILLKSITHREKDYEDIETIISIEKNINWDLIVDEALAQKKNNEWILIDLEKTLKLLKEITFIPSKHFKKIYSN